MKVGIRTPSIKKSIAARTTGKVKRKLKSTVNPLYGKKGMGFIKNPSKAVKGKIYRKTTVSAKDAATGLGGCLWGCIVLPFQLLWYLIKFVFVGGVWLFAAVVNGCMAIVHGSKCKAEHSQVEEAPAAYDNGAESAESSESADEPVSIGIESE